MPPQTRKLLTLIEALVAGRADFFFSRRDVRAHTGWGMTQARVHLDRLVEMEYLVVHHGGRGQNYVYELDLAASGSQLAGPKRPPDGRVAGDGGAHETRITIAPNAVLIDNREKPLLPGCEPMASHRRRSKSAKPAAAPPDKMHVLLAQYLAWLGAQNFSADTITTRRTMVNYFLDWCAERDLREPAELTRPTLERYQQWLYHHRKANGEPLTFRTQINRLRAIKGFFRWLARQNHILHNPASELMLPRLDSRLPKYVLTAKEAEQVLMQPDVNDPEGLRDRAMLEVFYATGMRRMELANLKLFDIDQDRGTVMIRQGKGKKDRHIPIGERALSWVAKYASDVRPRLLAGTDDGTLFLTHLGTAFSACN